MTDVMVILLVVLVVVLIVRGPRMLPKLGEALGRGVKDARQEVAKGFGESSDADSQEPPPA